MTANEAKEKFWKKDGVFEKFCDINYQTCRYAGATQEVALRNDLKLKIDGRYTFICVKKGE